MSLKQNKKQKNLCCKCLCLIAVFCVSLSQLCLRLLPSSFITDSPEDTQKQQVSAEDNQKHDRFCSRQNQKKNNCKNENRFQAAPTAMKKNSKFS